MGCSNLWEFFSNCCRQAQKPCVKVRNPHTARGVTLTTVMQKFLYGKNAAEEFVSSEWERKHASGVCKISGNF